MADTPVRPLHGIAILLVEDHDDAREIFGKYLSHQGALVAAARNGMEALIALQAFRVNVIVSDLSMPGMSGIELMEQIRMRPGEAQRPTPALAVTAAPHLCAAAFRAGFHRCMVKPLDPALLVQAIADLVARDA